MEQQMWGEIRETRSSECDKILSNEASKLVILSAFKPEMPKVKQPQPPENSDHLFMLEPQHSTMESNVLYTIQLIQHAKRVSELITHPNLKDEESLLEVIELPKPPVNIKKNKTLFPRPYTTKEDSPFTRGDPVTLPALGRDVTREILFKTVGTLTAHTGFDTAMNSALQVLTDVAGDFLKRFTKLLRCAVDREGLYGNSGFPDAMERVFHEIGLGSMVNLHEFYQQRVLQYRDRCEEHSISLQQQYEAALAYIKREPEESLRNKKERESEEDIPEIHFPAMTEGDCVVELQSSLEHGFQMLHSLEQEGQ